MRQRTHSLRIALEKLDWFEVALRAAQSYGHQAALDRIRRDLLADLHDAERDVSETVAPLVGWTEGTASIEEYRR